MNKFTKIFTDIGEFRFDNHDYLETLDAVKKAKETDGLLRIIRTSPGSVGAGKDVRQVMSEITTIFDLNNCKILGYEENIMTDVKVKSKK